MTNLPRTPLAPVDLEAAAEMWREYVAAHPAAVAAGVEHTVEQLGDSAELADDLLGLVLSGRKRATATLVADFAADGQPLPRMGSHWVACDGAGAPRAVLRTVELRIGPLDSVDDAFAFEEGKDDRAWESWLREHTRYFRRVCAARGEDWSAEQGIVFERIRVVWPPQHADRPAPRGPRAPVTLGRHLRGCSSMAEPQPSKLAMPVRSRSPAPRKTAGQTAC
jgi:uncharacterized protein YhfF